MSKIIEELCKEVENETEVRTKTETATMIALNMLSLKTIPLEVIAKCTQLPVEEVKELEKQLV